jgi:cation/acetate symporter
MRAKGALPVSAASGDRLTVATLLAVGAGAAVLMLLAQTGFPAAWTATLGANAYCAAVLAAGWRSRTLAFPNWIFVRREAQAPLGALAIAAAILPGFVPVILAGLFFADATSAAAWIVGPLAGLLAASILIAPFLRKSGAASPAAMVRKRFRSSLGGRLVSAIAMTCAFALLVGELRLAGILGGTMLPIGHDAVIVIVATMAAFTILLSGYPGVSQVAAISFLLLGAVWLAPLVWVSLQASGIPVPQIAQGPGAYGDVLALESELARLGIPPLAQRLDGAAGLDRLAFLPLALFLTLGTLALPQLAIHFPALARIGETRAATARAAILFALVITCAPAIAAFSKAGMYDRLLGLTVGETEASAPWLYSRNGVPALLSGDTPAFTICGGAPQTQAEAVELCGGNPDYVIGPATVTASADAVTLSFAPLRGLPEAMTGLLWLAVAAVAVAGAHATAFAFAGSAASFLRHRAMAPADGFVLFRARVACAAALAAAAVFAQRAEWPVLAPFFWAMAIAGGAIAPVIIMNIWWSRLTRPGVLAGAVTGPAILGAAFVLSATPPQFLMSAGFHARSGLAHLDFAIPAAFAAFAGSVVAMVAVSFAGRPPGRLELLEAMRVPDGRSPIEYPEF